MLLGYLSCVHETKGKQPRVRRGTFCSQFGDLDVLCPQEFSRRTPSFDSSDQGILNIFFGKRWQMAAVADGGSVTKLPQAYNAPPMIGLIWDGLGRFLGGVLSKDHGLPEGILMENRIIHFMGSHEKVLIGIPHSTRVLRRYSLYPFTLHPTPDPITVDWKSRLQPCYR
jgi:hypothetical protein